MEIEKKNAIQAWLPLIIAVVSQVAMLGWVSGRIEQRVSTVERDLARIEQGIKTDTTLSEAYVTRREYLIQLEASAYRSSQIDARLKEIRDRLDRITQ